MLHEESSKILHDGTIKVTYASDRLLPVRDWREKNTREKEKVEEQPKNKEK